CQEVATETGVTLATYMRYETGAEDAPLSYLSVLAAFYKVEVTALLTGGDAHARMFHVTRKGGGPVVERRHVYHYEALGARFAGKAMEPFIVTVGPALETLHLNTHPGQEFNYVLNGRLRVSVGGRETVLEPGDSIYFDASVPHGMRAEDGVEATFLAVITA
ncbi:MAG TPA: cupin domain-containing protein, partial [Kiritimatiellia bacterium]|nr:cupin domain-containing protein [Kiritimatiellia bacterium]